MRTGIAALLLCVSFAAASQAPTARHNAKADVDKKTAREERGSAEHPLVVVLKKEEPTPSEKTAAEDDRQEQKKGLLYEKRLAFWTVVLSIATLLLMVFTALLFWYTRKIAKEAKGSADIANDNAKRQIRAYVMMGESRIFGLLGDRPLECRLEIKNFGVTPATDVHYAASVDFDAIAQRAESAPLATLEGENKDSAPRHTLPSQGSITAISSDNTVLSPAEVGAITRGDAALCIHGTIYYKDIFNGAQTTTFRFAVGGKHGVTSHPNGGHFLSMCRFGNDAT